MRVTYMISLNHDVPAQSITKLHAYKFAANPRNPAQTRTFPRNATRKFGLAHAAMAYPSRDVSSDRAPPRGPFVPGRMRRLAKPRYQDRLALQTASPRYRVPRGRNRRQTRIPRDANDAGASARRRGE